MNVTASYSIPGSWGLSVVAQYGSGTPYTPRQSKNIGTLLINSEKKPSVFNVDLRLYKDIKFKFFTLSLFARVYNVFDTKNAYGVYNDTGRPDFTLDYLSALKQQPVQLVNPL
ncbi:TonB dependent receptor, partial [Candidatus Kryptonium thompsonii]